MATKSITQAKTVIPPDGWTQKTVFGFLGFDSTPAGRLVRLADVVRRLEDARCLPRSDAIRAVIDAMPADAMGWIYKIRPGQMAALVPIDCAFGQDTEESIAIKQRSIREANIQRYRKDRSASEWGGSSSSLFGVPRVFSAGQISAQMPAPVIPGLPAFLQYLKKWVDVSPERTLKGERIDSLDWKLEQLTYLAIPHVKAAEVWGWGRAADVDKLPNGTVADGINSAVAVRVRVKRSDWTQDQEATLLQDFRDSHESSDNNRTYAKSFKLSAL